MISPNAIPPVAPIGEEPSRKKNGGEKKKKESRVQGIGIEKISQRPLDSALLFSATSFYTMLFLLKMATCKKKKSYSWNKKTHVPKR